jgi:hypothetical protein
MQILKQIYRSNYAGESIVSELVLSNNDWQPTTEYITNSVFNTHTTNQAIAIGNGPSRDEFNLTHITNHRGGVLARNKLQSYGCNLVVNTGFNPDFLIVTDPDKVTAIAESDYAQDHIVYANAQYVIQHPGKFYLMPQNPAYDAGAMAAYLACFDGHTKVFLLGYDSYTNDNADSFYIKTLTAVMDTYKETEFVRVMPTAKYVCSDQLQSRVNFRQIGFRQFVTEADIG